jgi:hypothetical protein
LYKKQYSVSTSSVGGSGIPKADMANLPTPERIQINTTAVLSLSNTRRHSIIVVWEDFPVFLLFIETTNAIESALSNSKGF